MVNDSLGYHTREVVGGDVNNPSVGPTSRALYADGLDMLSDFASVAGWSGTQSTAASTAATSAALLTPRISSRWSHGYLRGGVRREKSFVSVGASGGEWWGEKKVGGKDGLAL